MEHSTITACKLLVFTLALVASHSHAGSVTINGWAHSIQSSWDQGWAAGENYPYGGIDSGAGKFSMQVTWGNPVQYYGDDDYAYTWNKDWDDYWLPISFNLAFETDRARYHISGEPEFVVDPNDWDTNLADVAGYVHVRQYSRWYRPDEGGYDCHDGYSDYCPEGFTELSMDPGMERSFYGYGSITYVDTSGKVLGGDGSGNSPQSIIQTYPVFLQKIGVSGPMTIDEAVTLLITASLKEFDVNFVGCISDCSGPYIQGARFVANEVPLPASAPLFVFSLGSLLALRRKFNL